MATSKTKTRKYRKSYYNPKAQVPFCSNVFVRKFIFIIIITVMLTIVIAVICAFTLNPQQRIQTDIPKLSSEYYEDYFYKNLTNSPRFQDAKAFNEVMDKYHTYGLPPIKLSDLLLYDNQKNAKYRNFLTKYCDENLTTIKFYPDSPYGKQDYRVDINYACNF